MSVVPAVQSLQVAGDLSGCPRAESGGAARTMISTVMPMTAQLDQTQACSTAGVRYSPPLARLQWCGWVMRTEAKTAQQRMGLRLRDVTWEGEKLGRLLSHH